MSHIVLFGDSIFDNSSYVGSGGKDVVTHLRELLPDDAKATLRAVDGAVIEGVHRQLLDAPETATHLVVSVGGNDAIRNADLLDMRAGSSAEVLEVISRRRDVFESQYREMLKTVLAKNLPTAVCTIYNPNFPEPQIQRIAVTALSIFNDVIIRHAILNNLPLLDLRLICNESSDYANPIEPSDTGGKKIAAKIYEMVRTQNSLGGRTTVFI
jgi:lysophospholipase L1-like esterase